MGKIIEAPYDAATRIRIAEMRQNRAEEQSIKDAGRYVEISMKNNRLTAENLRLREQVASQVKTINALMGCPRRLMIAAPVEVLP